MTSALARQKVREKELLEIKNTIISNLPVLSKRQIRRHRIPYHQALCLELEEDGYIESAGFIRSLIDYQDNFRAKAGPESIVWFKPILKDDKHMIDKLYTGLKAAETAVKMYQTNIECDNLLELGIFFSQQADGWWWLAEQLLLECVSSASNYTDDGGYHNALAKYVFGRFLLKQLNNAHEANHQLRKCRELSAGQKWSARDVLQIPLDNLFKESCLLLYEALLVIAQKMIETNPNKAARTCSIAQKRAIDAQDLKGEAECLFQLGLCEMKGGDASTALIKFNKALIMHFSTKNDVGICETRIHLALAHTRIGNITEANYHLQQLLDYSEKHELKYYNGQAHRFLGELHLRHGMAHDGTSHLLKALKIFHELDDYDNREQVKNLAAISAGQELAKKFRLILLTCEKGTKEGEKNLLKLVRWKDMREIFWGDTPLAIDSSLFTKREVKTFDEYDEMYGEFDEELDEEVRPEMQSEISEEITATDELSSSLYTTDDITDPENAVVLDTNM